jgi:hypothetical protein
MRAFAAIFFGIVAIGFSSRADVVNLMNGDRFTGSVELVNNAEVQLKSDSLGVVKLPRAKVLSIYFGTNLPPARVTGADKDAAAAGLFDPKAVEKVQDDFLATAGPEANAMFKDLIQGLASGKLNVDDIRKQASDSLKQLKELQADGGDDDSAILSTYVGILEHFINQGSTNKAKAAPSAKPASPDQKSADDQ